MSESTRKKMLHTTMNSLSQMYLPRDMTGPDRVRSTWVPFSCVALAWRADSSDNILHKRPLSDWDVDFHCKQKENLLELQYVLKVLKIKWQYQMIQNYQKGGGMKYNKATAIYLWHLSKNKKHVMNANTSM